MSADDAFLTMKTFFETRPAAAQAVGALRDNVEIGVVIGGVVECALFQKEGKPVLERRPAQGPDVIFLIRPESVYVLSNQQSNDIGEIGINILKEMLAGNIQLRVPGHFLNILRNGYLDMIKQGGARFSAFLATHGLSSATKIIEYVRRLTKHS